MSNETALSVEWLDSLGVHDESAPASCLCAIALRPGVWLDINEDGSLGIAQHGKPYFGLGDNDRSDVLKLLEALGVKINDHA